MIMSLLRLRWLSMAPQLASLLIVFGILWTAAGRVVDVEGSPGSVVWAVQLSDLHFCVFHPERGEDFRRIIGPALAMIKPYLVLITGDLTDGKSKDLLTMKQEEAEWIEYHNVMKDVIERSGLDETSFYDLRGNHDGFGVPVVGGAYDFFKKYSINAGLKRPRIVQSVTLKNGDWKHVFVGFDSTMKIGLRGPTNLFGHPTDQLMASLDKELSQWDSEQNLQITKISFGHFPLSFSAASESGKTLKDVFLKHSLSAYICGHLHTKFGKNLKRHHQFDPGSVNSGKYYQYNIHQGAQRNPASENCSSPVQEFWEWEMGDWRKSRSMRILAIDSGLVSYVDLNFQFGNKDIIIVPTFPVDSRFMQRVSAHQDYNCQQERRIPSYDTIRSLIFSRNEIISVSVKIYDSRPGNLHLVFDSAMQKFNVEKNNTRGDLYVAPWNWKAFADPLPDRYWLQIEVIDSFGVSSLSQMRPFSVNGLSARVSWNWKEFLVMGCQWASLYHPILRSILLLLFSMLLIPRAFLILYKKHCSFKNLNPGLRGKSIARGFISGVFWALLELSRISLIWSGFLLYLAYLLFFPWILGHVYSESDQMAYMTYRGWAINSAVDGNKERYVGEPDVMVIILPHLCFVVLPAVIVAAAMVSEKASYRSYYISLSGKKKDDYYGDGKKHSRKSFGAMSSRWLRKLLLLVSVLVLWKHWKYSRALVKAYEMNPFLHSPVYCFAIPVLLACVIYITSAV